jgi:putative CRISPR-associated protein (TIGR02619 family)
MSQKPLYMLSSCGTSLLTNGASGDIRTLLIKWANFRQEEIPKEVQALLEPHFTAQRKRFLETDTAEVKRLSAELNGLLTHYEESPYPKGEALHYLLLSATWQGECVGSILSEWLNDQGFVVQLLKISDLVTHPLERFQNGLSELARYCHSDIPTDSYQVIFNLTGGFKSVQGFLQTLALFYADGCISIFESGGLLRIPRLPVKLEVDPLVRKHLTLFRRLDRGGIPILEAGELPETFLYRMGNEVCLSGWGDLMWLQTREILWQEKVLEPISPLLEFEKKFTKTTNHLDAPRLYLLNAVIDKLERQLDSGHSSESQLNSAQIKPLRTKDYLPSDHEVYADNGDRILCHFDGKKLILDSLERHLKS